MAHAMAGLLFAVHPVHSEAVAGIVGRADLLACLFTLVAFLAYAAHCDDTRNPAPLFLTLVASALATLAKETGIASLALCLLWEFCRGEPRRKVGKVITNFPEIIINKELYNQRFKRFFKITFSKCQADIKKRFIYF